MAPFPETEIMTIKRLEVALRKMDNKLLKDGAYKLHEKFHSGHRFEYTDLLKDILLNITNNSAVPADSKDILIPTIQDILTKEGVAFDTSSSPSESLSQNKVSSLTSLSYNSAIEDNSDGNVQVAQKIDAFSAFGSERASENQNENKTFTQSPFSAEPFKEYNAASVISHVHSQSPQLNEAPQNQENINENHPQEQEYKYAEVSKENKTIAMFYNQESSIEKISNIAKLNDMLSKMEDDNISINSVLNLISEITIQSNTQVTELKSILDHLNTKENKVNLITNSQSANLVHLLNASQISFDIFNDETDKKINLMPIFSLSNLFKCSRCTNAHLDSTSEIAPMVLQCPRCKSPMFPTFYTAKDNYAQIDLENYNSCLIGLANSKIWLIVNPSEDKFSLNLLKSAFAMSNVVEEVFVVHKDINTREMFKNLFNHIKPSIKINVSTTVIEDFIRTI